MSVRPLAVIALATSVAHPAAAFTDALDAPGASERLLYLVLLLAGLLVFSRRRASIGSTMKMAAAWVAIFGAAMLAYSLFRAPDPTAAIVRAEGEVELRKSGDGHFHAATEVDGAAVRMTIDTGASLVLLSHEDAKAVGFDTDSLSFTQPVSTANGRAHVALVTLGRVAIGPVELYDVPAAVAQEGAVRTSLLGMSFLGQLTETSFRGDRLILRN